MNYFNDEQQSWMRTLAKLPPEKKCDCGWSYRGECFGSCYGQPEKGGAPRKGDEPKKQNNPILPQTGR